MSSFESLCTQGEFIPDRFIVELEGITYNHPKGERTVRIDEAALRQQGRVYSDDSLLIDSLIESGGIKVSRHAELLSFIEAAYDEPLPIVGVSGYATVGFAYEKEAQALRHMYNHFRKKEQPFGLTVDGGVSSGVLGINGLASLIGGVTSLGVIPKQGLHRVGVRDHLAVWGDTYQDREVIVGTVPDVLVCVGGADGTRRECQEALKHGSAVLLLAMGDAPSGSLAATYDQYKDIEGAIRDGTMMISRSPEGFVSELSELIEYSCMNYDNRSWRFEALQQYMHTEKGIS